VKLLRERIRATGKVIALQVLVIDEVVVDDEEWEMRKLYDILYLNAAVCKRFGVVTA
jgi:hypothetical protein